MSEQPYKPTLDKPDLDSLDLAVSIFNRTDLVFHNSLDILGSYLNLLNNCCSRTISYTIERDNGIIQLFSSDAAIDKSPSLIHHCGVEKSMVHYLRFLISNIEYEHNEFLLDIEDMAECFY